MRQAHVTAKKVLAWGQRPDVIVSSPMTRSLQTAALVFETDIAAGVPLVVTAELREFFPHLVEDMGRPVGVLVRDPVITELPNASVITRALENMVRREDWDSHLANGAKSAAGGGWEAHSNDSERCAQFAHWLQQDNVNNLPCLGAGGRARKIATVSHWGMINHFLNRFDCVDAAGLKRSTPVPMDERAKLRYGSTQSWMPDCGVVKLRMTNCGWVGARFRSIASTTS